MGKILIIEDDEALRSFVSLLCNELGYEVIAPITFYNGSSLLNSQKFDLVIVEGSPLQNPSFPLPWIDGEAGGLSARSLLKIILPRILQLTPTPEFIFISRGGFPAEGQYAIENGALDYISIPRGCSDDAEVVHYPERIKDRLTNVIKHAFKIIDGSFSNGLDLTGVIGSSWQVKRSVLRLVQASKNDDNVLITGETGTGKTLFARRIHENSNRKEGPFVIFDCKSKSEPGTELELLGHDSKQGKLYVATDGTLLLYEIDNLSLSLQAKLLWTLRDPDFSKSNNDHTKNSAFRLISSSSSNLEDLVAVGKFRKDLYFEISTFKIKLPPLRDRKEDIPILANFYADEICRDTGTNMKVEWSPDFEKALQGYRWPGNILELINALKAAISKAGVNRNLNSFNLPREIQSSSAKALFYDSIDINENSFKLVSNILNSKAVAISKADIQRFSEVKDASKKQKKTYETQVKSQDSPSKPQQFNFTEVSSEVDKPTFYFYEDADFWSVGERGKEKHLKKLDGFGYIHFLLLYPNESFNPKFVYHKGVSMIQKEGLVTLDKLANYDALAFTKLDEKTRKAYSLRIEELEAKLKSQDFNDPHEALEDKDEIERLTYTLKKKVIRDPKSPQEKARVNTTKKIKEVLKRIHEAIPEMKQYLNKSTIKTGDSLSYSPLPDQTPNWILQRYLSTRK
jgi:two-component system NtrC family response regulator